MGFSNIRSKIKMSTTCQHTYAKLGNLGNFKADDLYTTEHIKKSELLL